MLKHLGANAKAAVWTEATKSHDVESSLSIQHIHPAAYTTHHHIIVVCCSKKIQFINSLHIEEDWGKRKMIIFKVRAHMQY